MAGQHGPFAGAASAEGAGVGLLCLRQAWPLAPMLPLPLGTVLLRGLSIRTLAGSPPALHESLCRSRGWELPDGEYRAATHGGGWFLGLMPSCGGILPASR